MGAEQFTTTVEGHGTDHKAAFAAAVKEAEFFYGHGGYTGSIAEKGSYVVIDTAGRSLGEAEEYADQLMQAYDPRIDDKWGPAGALPYWNAIETGRRTVKRRIRVTGDTPAHQAVSDFVAAAARKGERAGRITGTGQPVATKVRKQSSSTKGATKKIFEVTGTSMRPNGAVGRSFGTLAEARAAMDAALTADAAAGRVVKYSITSRTVREDGSALASGSTEMVWADYDVEVEFITEKPGTSAVPDGWLFFGWASS